MSAGSFQSHLQPFMAVLGQASVRCHASVNSIQISSVVFLIAHRAAASCLARRSKFMGCNAHCESRYTFSFAILVYCAAHWFR